MFERAKKSSAPDCCRACKLSSSAHFLEQEERANLASIRLFFLSGPPLLPLSLVRRRFGERAALEEAAQRKDAGVREALSIAAALASAERGSSSACSGKRKILVRGREEDDERGYEVKARGGE